MGPAYPIGTKGKVFEGRIWTQLRNGDAPAVTVFVKTQDDVPSRVNAVHLVKIDIIEPHHLPLFDSASNVVNEENYKAKAASIRVLSRPQRRVVVLLLILIYVRDERPSKVRFREELTPEHCVYLLRIVLLILCHIPEFPLILGPDFDLLQVDLTIGVEDHDEIPARCEVRHHKWDAHCLVINSVSHVEPVKIQDAAVVVIGGLWSNPALVRSQPGNSPFSEFGCRGDSSCREGDLESSHLIEPCLVFS